MGELFSNYSICSKARLHVKTEVIFESRGLGTTKMPSRWELQSLRYQVAQDTTFLVLEGRWKKKRPILQF